MASVLILDGDRRSCRQLYALLGARFKARAFHAVFRAFNHLKRHASDVVVVKISGTDASATAMLTWLRRHGLQIPMIVLLDHGASHDAQPIRQLGALRVLRWPLTNVELLSTVRAAAARNVKCMDRSA